MNGIGNAIGSILEVLYCLGISLAILALLGIWKLIEIIIWLWAHVHFGAAA
jgi:hypothetical protein